MLIKKQPYNNNIILKYFKQPKSFYLIFSIELWERFGYYGLQSILVIYLVKALNLSENNAITLFSSFSALVYGFVVIGGWLGDKILGTKRVIILGAIVLTIGYSIIAWANNEIYMIYIGMSTIAVGSGLFKANPSSLLSNCYKKNDPRIEGAFTMYYMAINIGSFLSMLITPWLATYYGWNIAFSLSIFGMLITLINFIYCLDCVKQNGSIPDFITLKLSRLLIVIISIIILIPFSSWLLLHQNIMYLVLSAMMISILLILIYECILLNKNDRRHMGVVFIMILEGAIFFILYNQIPTSLNFFAIHNVENTLLGLKFKPEQFQALNPFWIILISPVLTKTYNYLGKNLTISFKFAIGMILSSLAFLILPLGAKFANETGIVSIYWLIISYALQSAGELMISGLGLALIAKLVPQRLMGFVMGFWFLATSISAVVAGFIAKLSVLPISKIQNPHQTLNIYSNIFMNIGLYTMVLAILMLIFASKVDHLSRINR